MQRKIFHFYNNLISVKFRLNVSGPNLEGSIFQTQKLTAYSVLTAHSVHAPPNLHGKFYWAFFFAAITYTWSVVTRSPHSHARPIFILAPWKVPSPLHPPTFPGPSPCSPPNLLCVWWIEGRYPQGHARQRDLDSFYWTLLQMQLEVCHQPPVQRLVRFHRRPVVVRRSAQVNHVLHLNRHPSAIVYHGFLQVHYLLLKGPLISKFVVDWREQSSRSIFGVFS